MGSSGRTLNPEASSQLQERSFECVWEAFVLGRFRLCWPRGLNKDGWIFFGGVSVTANLNGARGSSPFGSGLAFRKGNCTSLAACAGWTWRGFHPGTVKGNAQEEPLAPCGAKTRVPWVDNAVATVPTSKVVGTVMVLVARYLFWQLLVGYGLYIRYLLHGPVPHPGRATPRPHFSHILAFRGGVASRSNTNLTPAQPRSLWVVGPPTQRGRPEALSARHRPVGRPLLHWNHRFARLHHGRRGRRADVRERAQGT